MSDPIQRKGPGGASGVTEGAAPAGAGAAFRAAVATAEGAQGTQPCLGIFRWLLPVGFNAGSRGLHHLSHGDQPIRQVGAGRPASAHQLRL